MAITQTYVDYGAGSDVTGDGSIGNPWKTLQWAFDHLVRNTTDGNQVNLKAGAAHVNAAALDLTTFVAGGALSSAAPLIVRGYTATANDGGMGEIDCGGATMWAGTYQYLFLIGLEIHTGGNNHLLTVGVGSVVVGCELHKGASAPSAKYMINTQNWNSCVYGCYVHDIGAGASRGISGSGANIGAYNYVDMGTESTGSGIYQFPTALGNIVLCRATGQIGIQVAQNVIGNIVYNTTAGTASGISITAGYNAVSNILCGFNGAGGKGIMTTNPAAVGHNAFWNNTANYTHNDQVYGDLTANDVTLAADPFTSAATGDFSLTEAAKAALAGKGFPLTYLGAHANSVPNLNIGPIQNVLAAGGGGGGFPILGGSVVR